MSSADCNTAVTPISNSVTYRSFAGDRHVYLKEIHFKNRERIGTKA